MRGNHTENSTRINRVILTLIVASLVSVSGLGQTSNAIISGTVKDQSTRIVPGVGITVTNTDTGTRRTSVSDSEGRYALPELAPGTYQITAALTGFQTYIHSGIILSVGQHAVVDLVLRIGETGISISQAISAGLLVAGLLGLARVYRRPPTAS